MTESPPTILALASTNAAAPQTVGTPASSIESASKSESTVVTALPSVAPPQSPWAYANANPDDDFVVAPPSPRDGCHDALRAAGVKFSPASLPPHVEGKSKRMCGAEQVVVYLKSPAGIGYDPPPMVTCTMALALARFDAIAQEEATRILGDRIYRVKHLGTYACRNMAAYPGWVSEHSYANAIDLAFFTLKSGKKVAILNDFEKADATKTPRGEFLRLLSRRAYDENVFSNVLTPFFDALHKDHFHLDLARYRNDGTRPIR